MIYRYREKREHTHTHTHTHTRPYAYTHTHRETRAHRHTDTQIRHTRKHTLSLSLTEGEREFYLTEAQGTELRLKHPRAGRSRSKYYGLHILLVRRLFPLVLYMAGMCARTVSLVVDQNVGQCLLLRRRPVPTSV